MNDRNFYKSLLLNLQTDTGNTSSDCYSSFDTLMSQYDAIRLSVTNDAQYFEGLKKKGQGEGTDIGYFLDKGMKYMDMLTASTNVYNNCDVDYYMIALSKASGNVAGFINQTVNTLFRNFSEGDLDNYTLLAASLEAGKTDDIAKYFATFFKDFLMAEIPDNSAVATYQTVS